MIHPMTQVQYIDIKTGEPRYNTINGLYQEYCHKSIRVVDSKYFKIDKITFDEDSNILITDLFGWTKLKTIRKIYDTNNIIWRNINVSNKHIVLSSEEYIPFYDTTKTKIGFHGEVKYNYKLKYLKKSNKNDYLRLKHGEDKDGNLIEFANIRSYSRFNDNTFHGYELITKSKFFNGNDIHLYANDMIDLDDVLKWK